MNRPVSVLRRMRPVLGTFAEVGVFAPDERAAPAIARAFDELARVERLMSFQDPDSELSLLNRRPGSLVKLSGITRRALRLAAEMTRASGHLFNCTVGGLLVARGSLPDHGGEACLPIGDASCLEFSGDGVRLRRPVRITLDGIAKGLAVDRALACLRGLGVRSAWINAGGDLRVQGPHSLEVRLRGSARVHSLHQGALATSAAAHDGSGTFPGILVGEAGNAVARGPWTVLAPQAWLADALTKVAALATTANREALISRLGGRLVTIDDSDAGVRAA